MNRILSVACLVMLLVFGFGGNASSQMVQYGKVVEANSKGKTLSGVYIKLTNEVSDYQPTTSDSQGLFRLCFNEQKVGKAVHVIAEKSGYDLVNIHIYRDGWILSDSERLIVEMAPKGKVEKERKRYYGLLETAYVERYETTIKLLDADFAQQKIDMAEYQCWKMKAEDELHQSFKNIMEYADIFARVNSDNKDDNTVALVAMLEANDMEGAMALVDGEPYAGVMEDYNGFTLSFPMTIPEVSVASAATVVTDLQPEDSLYEDIIVLQTYTKWFENDFTESSLKYAQACVYLGLLYQQKGWSEASVKYLTKALRMYEMLNLLDGVEVQDKIDKIKQRLDN